MSNTQKIEPARFEYGYKNVSTRRNDQATLTCQAMGDEPLNIYWSHNNQRIDLNNYRLSITEMKTDNGITSQLSITRADRIDSGKYRCIAENAFGKSEQIIYLAVQGKFLPSVLLPTGINGFALCRAPRGTI